MNNIKISILIPIYNVEKYLEKCLSSIIGQTLNDIEIICINDGSKDSSSEIIKKYSANDNRIVVINKANTGYGDSMNKGLEIAQGEYIGIVESDDFVEKNMFEELYYLAKKYNADIVKSNFNLFWEENERKIFKNNLKISDIIDNTELAREHVFWGLPAIWSAIYKKSFLDNNKIKFLPTPGASYQDTSFYFKTTCMANRIIVTPSPYLNYRQDNSASSVKNSSMEKVYLLHEEWNEIEKYLKKTIYAKKNKIYFNTLRFNGYIWNYRRISSKDRKEYFPKLREVVNKSDMMFDFGHMPKYCKYGGYFAVKYNSRVLLNIMLLLSDLFNHENK